MALGPPNMERHERWILAIIIISTLLAGFELGISPGASIVGGYSYWTGLTCSILTVMLHSVTIQLWKSTAKRRQGTPQPPFIYSITLHVLTCLLAVFWLASFILTFVVASTLLKYNDGRYHSGRPDDPTIGYVEAVFALFNSLLLWLFFAFIVHYRKWFLRTRGNPQPEPPHPSPPQYMLVVYYRRWFMRMTGMPEPEPLIPYPPNPPPNPSTNNPIYNPTPNPPNNSPIYNPGLNLDQPPDLPPKSEPSPTFNAIPNPVSPATGLETHLKWILRIIVTCMVLCIIEFGISLGDGAFGGFSLWLAVVSAVLTVALHCVTLP
ncbi:hypothetical protein FRC17_009900, partial [Serendipita sp. 399]